MNRLRLIVLLGLSLAFTGSSFAKGHGDKDRDRDDVRHHDRDRDGDHDRDDHRVRRHRDHDRDDRRVALRHHNSSRPPGWNHGEKKGWGNCNAAPGQAKKAGCNTVHRRHKRVVVAHKDKDHDGDRH